MKSIKHAVEELGVSAQRVRELCRAGRIAGAVLIGATWILPDMIAVSPSEDGRPFKKIGVVENDKESIV